MFVPLNVSVEVPVIVRLNVVAVVLEIAPLMVRFPPFPDCAIVWVPDAAPMTMGAAIVLVPLVIVEVIIPVAPVPVFVRVSLVLVFVLVRL